MNPKNIQTSNYAHNGENLDAIGISCSSPKWFMGATFPLLAPEWAMVDSIKKGLISEKEYTLQYINLIKNRRNQGQLTAAMIYDMLPENSILLCYEPPNEFCHRRVLAEWINIETGIEIPEWKSENETTQEIQDGVVDSLLDF
jgi:hypothetical protein